MCLSLVALVRFHRWGVQEGQCKKRALLWIGGASPGKTEMPPNLQAGFVVDEHFGQRRQKGRLLFAFPNVLAQGVPFTQDHTLRMSSIKVSGTCVSTTCGMEKESLRHLSWH